MSENSMEILIKEIVPMLWKYTFYDETTVVRSAFEALSNFHLENLELKYFPKEYWSPEELAEPVTETTSLHSNSCVNSASSIYISGN